MTSRPWSFATEDLLKHPASLVHLSSRLRSHPFFPRPCGFSVQSSQCLPLPAGPQLSLKHPRSLALVACSQGTLHVYPSLFPTTPFQTPDAVSPAETYTLVN